MPYATEYVNPEVFVTANGPGGEPVTVYHAYNDGDYDRRLEYWFAVKDTNPETSHFDSPDPDGIEFDVRTLPRVPGPDENVNWIHKRIEAAIKSGILADGKVPPPDE